MKSNFKFLAVIALLFVNILTDTISYIDRGEIRKLVESRQQIGLIIIHAGARANAFTDEEKAKICTAWHDAGYGAKGEKCPF